MKNGLLIAALVLLTGGFLLIADARAANGDFSPNPGLREGNTARYSPAGQMERIHQGIASGQLTRGEARSLTREQRRIRQMERCYRADGRLDRRERRQLQSMRSDADEHIRRLKHNRARTRIVEERVALGHYRW